MNTHLNNKFHLPHIGQRMVKTSIAVFICLLVYRLLGFEGETMPAEAVITAIICMQPFISDSRSFAFNRFFGTMTGAVWGLLFLLMLYRFPILGQNFVVLYALMAIGALLSVYTAVALKVPDASGLSAIVFICIVVRFPDIVQPFMEVAKRFLGVSIGTIVAIIVNTARLPRNKDKNCVLFVRAKDLTPDRFSHVPAQVLFHMNRLYNDGAKICIILEHAPAFFTMQMSACHLNVPLIVMDGAAIFDTNVNRYISITTMDSKKSNWLQKWLGDRKIGYFTYTVHHNRTCVYHSGEMNEQELLVLKRLQRSPYRSYLDDDNFMQEEIVYFKIIEAHEALIALQRKLQPLLKAHGLRTVIRDQASTPGVSGLYIYPEESTVKNAQKYLMEILQVVYPNENLYPVDIFSRDDCYTEHSAATLLRRMRDAYEPPIFVKKKGSSPRHEA